MKTDFSKTRAMFDIPQGLTYLNGNSLGPMPKAAINSITDFLNEEWKTELIKGWNTKGWMMQPNVIGDKLAKLIGADAGTTVVGDTLSIKIFQAVAAGLDLVPKRKVILSDSGNFPTDLYMVEGLMPLKSGGYELRTPTPENLIDCIDKSVAVVLVTEVDYRSGRKHDMAAIIKKAHANGAVVVWDLAHSAGAISVDLGGLDVDFAAGCTYKYLNGGPGSPAFIYVAKRLHDTVKPALSGWLGHAAPFNFDLGYQPADSITRMRVGTPSVAASYLLSAALDIWDHVDMADLRARSIELSEMFITEVEKRCPDLILASPRDPHQRGSHVSFKFKHGYACMRAMIAQNVIGDFRAPDIMRFGISPLYNDMHDIMRASEVLERILKDQIWKQEQFQVRSLVT